MNDGLLLRGPLATHSVATGWRSAPLWTVILPAWFRDTVYGYECECVSRWILPEALLL